MVVGQYWHYGNGRGYGYGYVTLSGNSNWTLWKLVTVAQNWKKGWGRSAFIWKRQKNEPEFKSRYLQQEAEAGWMGRQSRWASTVSQKKKYILCVYGNLYLAAGIRKQVGVFPAAYICIYFRGLFLSTRQNTWCGYQNLGKCANSLNYGVVAPAFLSHAEPAETAIR